MKEKDITQLLVHSDNQPVVRVLNAMVSASPALISDLRKLRSLLLALGVQIEARRMPSAANRFADALFRTWRTYDLRTTKCLVEDLIKKYDTERVSFYHRPFNEPLPVRWKFLLGQFNERWDDGTNRLFTPPPDMLPFVIQKIRTERAKGVLVAPFWPAQPWFAELTKVAVALRVLTHRKYPFDRPYPSTRHINPRWRAVVATL